jgi:hypothetical protein
MRTLFTQILRSDVVKNIRRSASEGPAIVLMPELCMPRAFMTPLLRMLSFEGIHLMAGVEYAVTEQSGARFATNQCVVMTSEDPPWKWIPRFCTKTATAVEERLHLTNVAGVQFSNTGAKKKNRNIYSAEYELES